MTTFHIRTIRSAALIATLFATMVAAPTLADDARQSLKQSSNAYFSVYSYNCAPDFYAEKAYAAPADSMVAAAASSAFRSEYGTDCRAFYLSEIVPLLEGAAAEVVVARN